MFKQGDEVRLVASNYAAIKPGQIGIVTKVARVTDFGLPYFTRVDVAWDGTWVPLRMIPEDGDRMQVV